MTRLITSKEVVANFLAANELKGFDFINEASLLESKIKDTLNKYLVQQEESLMALVINGDRRKNLEDHLWSLEEVELKYIGGYPKIGDLPRDWSECSIIDIAKFIQENGNNLGISKSIRRIRSIQPHVDIISKYLYPILLPGGEIRKSDMLLPLPFDSDDGNHRLIAMALSGNKSALSYIGIP